MILSAKTALMFGAVVVGAGVVCPFCLQRGDGHAAQTLAVAAPATDTATVRLHISGMTCGTCPTTARVALQKLAGVYSAKITLDDSLGIVRYDPRRVTPDSIAAHLLRLTGFAAKVLPDPKTAPKPSPGAPA